MSEETAPGPTGELLKFAIRTAAGQVWLYGHRRAMESDVPVVLALTGAFEGQDSFGAFPALLPEFAVLRANLPGNYCPEVADASVEAYADAFSLALDHIGRSAIVCGASVGALVALAIRSRHVRGLVLVEPTLRTAKLWPLIPQIRLVLRGLQSEWANRFAWQVLGMSPDAVEDRDYTELLGRSRAPATFVVGDDPLMPQRPIKYVTSYVDVPERALISGRPDTRLVTLPGVGHGVLPAAADIVAGEVRSLAASLDLMSAGVADPTFLHRR